MNTNNGLKLPQRSALEKFASRSREEKEEFFLLFAKLLTEDLKKQQRNEGVAPESPRELDGKKASRKPPTTAKLSETTKSKARGRVKFVEVRKPRAVSTLFGTPKPEAEP